MSAIDRIMSAQTFEKGTYLGLAEGRVPSGKEVADEATVAELLSQVKNGEYTLTIDKVIYKATSNTIGEMIAVEFTVDESNTDKHAPGSKRAWVQKLTTAVGLSAYKAFLYAALGANTPEEKAKADKALPGILAAIEANKPHVVLGRKLRCSVSPYKTKEHKHITINRFAPV